MKTRKYFCFVCILIIFTVVFAFTGCKDDAGENDEPPAMRGPVEFRIYWLGGPYEERVDNRLHRTNIEFVGTFDEFTWKGICLRFESAFDKLQMGQQKWGGTTIVEPIISEAILYDIFGVIEIIHPEGGGERWEREAPTKGVIVMESAPKTDYEWYKVTGEKHLADISGDRYYSYGGWYFDSYLDNRKNVLYINYNNIDRLLVPIDDGNGGQKPALAVAILALHKAVTTDVLSQK